MEDRIIESDITEVPAIPEDLMENLVYALEEGKKILVAASHGESFAPFTATVALDKVFIESYACDDPEESFEMARTRIENSKGMVSYALCYDGFVDSENSDYDAIIAEGGMPGSEEGYAIAQIYKSSGDPEKGDVSYEFRGEAIYLGPSPNFAQNLHNPDTYSDAEISQSFTR